jgi:hypothetical protein
LQIIFIHKKMARFSLKGALSKVGSVFRKKTGTSASSGPVALLKKRAGRTRGFGGRNDTTRGGGGS